MKTNKTNNTLWFSNEFFDYIKYSIEQYELEMANERLDPIKVLHRTYIGRHVRMADIIEKINKKTKWLNLLEDFAWLVSFSLSLWLDISTIREQISKKIGRESDADIKSVYADINFILESQYPNLIPMKRDIDGARKYSGKF